MTWINSLEFCAGQARAVNLGMVRQAPGEVPSYGLLSRRLKAVGAAGSARLGATGMSNESRKAHLIGSGIANLAVAGHGGSSPPLSDEIVLLLSEVLNSAKLP